MESSFISVNSCEVQVRFDWWQKNLLVKVDLSSEKASVSFIWTTVKYKRDLTYKDRRAYWWRSVSGSEKSSEDHRLPIQWTTLKSFWCCQQRRIQRKTGYSYLVGPYSWTILSKASPSILQFQKPISGR